MRKHKRGEQKMIIDFHTRRELSMDVAFVRAAHAQMDLAAAYDINSQTCDEIDDVNNLQAEDAGARLRRLAAHLRHLAADMQALQAGCLAAMNSAEWR